MSAGWQHRTSLVKRVLTATVKTYEAEVGRILGGVLSPEEQQMSDAADLPTDVLQAYLDAVAAGRLTVPIDRTYALDEIAQAHADMEHGRATGKLVVLP
jgi:NADPH:quinone reductase-like Zn-dependent oxidoreductase